MFCISGSYPPLRDARRFAESQTPFQDEPVRIVFRSTRYEILRSNATGQDNPRRSQLPLLYLDRVSIEAAMRFAAHPTT